MHPNSKLENENKKAGQEQAEGIFFWKKGISKKHRMVDRLSSIPMSKPNPNTNLPMCFEALVNHLQNFTSHFQLGKSYEIWLYNFHWFDNLEFGNCVIELGIIFDFWKFGLNMKTDLCHLYLFEIFNLLKDGPASTLQKNLNTPTIYLFVFVACSYFIKSFVLSFLCSFSILNFVGCDS